MQRNNKIVLITGIAGLLGSHLSQYLLSKSYIVVGIDDLSGGYLDFVPNEIIEQGNFHQINLVDQHQVEEVFKKYSPDYVYHFAAYAAEGLSPFIRNFNYTNNLLCSVNVINCCVRHNVKKIIFTSSIAVYGHGNPPYFESHFPTPADPYGIAKYAVELDLQQANEQFGLNYTIVRPHNVIGIQQNIWDMYRNVVGIFIRQTLAGEPITIYGDGTQTRAFSDIKYYLSPFEKLLEVGNSEIFNLGADRKYTLNHIAKAVQYAGKKLGYHSEIIHLEARLEVKHALCNHDKAKRELNFYDDTNIELTIDEMFNWALSQTSRSIKRMDYEISKNMYTFWK
jgi:UDP-glucose 4-epimerase